MTTRCPHGVYAICHQCADPLHVPEEDHPAPARRLGCLLAILSSLVTVSIAWWLL